MDIVVVRILVGAAAFAAAVVIVAVLLQMIFRDTMHYNARLKHKFELAEIFVSINFIIKVEEDIYERYLTNNGETDFAALTNTEFQNIYNDLSMRCLKAVSPEMWNMVELYMTRESIQTYISQEVYNYLWDKVNPELA